MPYPDAAKQTQQTIPSPCGMNRAFANAEVSPSCDSETDSAAGAGTESTGRTSLRSLLVLMTALLVAMSPLAARSLKAEDQNEFRFILDLIKPEPATNATKELQKKWETAKPDARRPAPTQPVLTPSQIRRETRASSPEQVTTFRPIGRTPRIADALPRVKKSNQSSKRDIGSAGMLEGTVHIEHLFLSDDYSQWTQFEKDRVRRKLNEAYHFISFQSRRFPSRDRKPLRFLDAHFEDITVKGRIPRDAHADPKWTETAIGLYGEGSAEKKVEQIKRQSNPDHVIFCLHVNKPALSYNLAFYDNVAPIYAAERMICFTSYPDTRETSAATYAHEILHLFGAGDLYFPYDKTPARKESAAQRFPDDVMYRVDYDIFRLSIEAFTAYRIGWVDHLPTDLLYLED